jgi:hypothetical protein
MRIFTRAGKAAASAVTGLALTVGTVGLAAPAQADTTMTLTGPASGVPGSVATYTVTGGTAGTIVLQDPNNGGQYGAEQFWAFGTPSVSFSFSLRTPPTPSM